MDAQGNTPAGCEPAIRQVADDGGVVWPAVRSGSSFSGLPSKQSDAEQTACQEAGGQYTNTPNFRHLGPKESGEQLALQACFGPAANQRGYELLTLVLASAVDSRYGDPAALCSKVPGTVASAELTSVGDIRGLQWGDTRPAAGVFGKASADDIAAWCWVRDDASRQFVVWGTHDGDAPQQLVTLTTAMYGSGANPSGAPMSPPPASLAPVGGINHTEADALCAAAVPDYVSSWPTTIDQLRKTTWGTDHTRAPLAHVFPSASGIDPAAWCWTDNGTVWTDYVVHSGDAPVQATVVSNVPDGLVPAGPPLFPADAAPAATPTRGHTAADALCKAALPDYLTATLTTVADVRSATWGPPPGTGRAAAARVPRGEGRRLLPGAGTG